jgi:hypothetical protein
MLAREDAVLPFAVTKAQILKLVQRQTTPIGTAIERLR